MARYKVTLWFEINIFRVTDFFKKKAAGRHAFARSTAVTRLDYLLESFEGEAVFAYFNECTDNGTYHVAQEAVGSDFKIP